MYLYAFQFKLRSYLFSVFLVDFGFWFVYRKAKKEKKKQRLNERNELDTHTHTHLVKKEASMFHKDPHPTLYNTK